VSGLLIPPPTHPPLPHSAGRETEAVARLQTRQVEPRLEAVGAVGVHCEGDGMAPTEHSPVPSKTLKRRDGKKKRRKQIRSKNAGRKKNNETTNDANHINFYKFYIPRAEAWGDSEPRLSRRHGESIGPVEFKNKHALRKGWIQILLKMQIKREKYRAVVGFIYERDSLGKK